MPLYYMKGFDIGIGYVKGLLHLGTQFWFWKLLDEKHVAISFCLRASK